MYSAANFLESMAKGNKQNKDCFLHEWFSLALGCPIPFGVKGEAKISAHRRYCLRHILGDANCFLGYTLCFWLKPVKLGKPFIVRRHCVHEGWISGKIEDTWSLEAYYLFKASTNAIGALPIQPNTCVLAADCATRHTQVIACCIVPQAHWVANTFSSCEVPTLRISSENHGVSGCLYQKHHRCLFCLQGTGNMSEHQSVCCFLPASWRLQVQINFKTQEYEMNMGSSNSRAKFHKQRIPVARLSILNPTSGSIKTSECIWRDIMSL